jgi:hypothetical protein
MENEENQPWQLQVLKRCVLNGSAAQPCPVASILWAIEMIERPEVVRDSNNSKIG